jgi:hypothetical protein
MFVVARDLGAREPSQGALLAEEPGIGTLADLGGAAREWMPTWEKPDHVQEFAEELTPPSWSGHF